MFPIVPAAASCKAASEDPTIPSKSCTTPCSCIEIQLSAIQKLGRDGD